jgi:tetratricopeptide (TPR) repeat protein/TolB-like protein
MTVRPQTGRDGEKTSAKPKVFVSYSRKNLRFVVRLVRDLERDGFEVWFDERIRGGDASPGKIAQAIRGADFFLVVVSRHSNKSSWVQNELNKAVTWETESGRPRTIPIRGGNSPLPDIVVEKHYVPFGIASYQRNYAELRSALLEQEPPAVRPSPVTQSSRKSMVVAAAVALALLIALGVWSFFGRLADLPTIAITSFANDSQRAEDAWISTALGDMLTIALRTGGGARIVDREEVSAAERDFLLAGKRPLPADFRRRLWADYVVSGSFHRPPTDYAPLVISISWRLADTTARGDPGTSEKNGSLVNLVSLVSDLADGIRSHLRVHLKSSQQKTELQSLFPRSPEGLELYFAGVESHRTFEPSTAYNWLEAARVKEPDQPLIYRRLASVAWDLGREEEAKALAGKARQLAGKLPLAGSLLRERLEIELAESRIAGRLSEAIAQYKRLQDLAPKEYSYWLKMADDQESAGALNEALSTLDDLLAKQPAPPLYINARALRMKANIQDNLGERTKALDLVDLAITKATGAEATYRLAEARFVRSQILQGVGKIALAMSDLDAAQRTFSQAKDKYYVRVCKEQRAILEYYLGMRPLSEILEDLWKLEKKYREEIAGEELARVLALESMILSDQGRSAEADEKLTEAEAALADGNKDVLISLFAGRVRNLILGGKPKDASQMAARALRIQNIASSSKTATLYTDLAESFYYSGMLKDAEENQAQALKSHSGSLEAYDRFRLGMILAAQGKVEGRREIENAYDLQKQMADNADWAETALGLARLDTLAGDFSAAVDLAENAEAVLRRAGRSDTVALAQVARAWALICQGDTVAAERALTSAEPRSRVSDDFRVQFETSIVGARVQALSRQRGADAIGDLERIRQEAHERGLRLYEFDARLALGEVKLALKAGGRPDLELLAKEAEGSGFHQIARLATKALKEGPVCSGRPLTFLDRLSHRWSQWLE